MQDIQKEVSQIDDEKFPIGTEKGGLLSKIWKFNG